MKRSSKIVALLLAAAMVISAFPALTEISAVAEETEYVWGFEEGTIAPFRLESGSLEHPIGNRTTEINSPYSAINKTGTYYLTTVETGTGNTFSNAQTATLVSPTFYISGTSIRMKLAGGMEKMFMLQ